jgi:outer membrane protein OmpA-like peptidoglycan-associated protein
VGMSNLTIKKLKSRAIGSYAVRLMSAGFLIGVLGCSSTPVPGPDKQGSHTAFGALEGAGAGMITGAQVAGATGPGAAIGAGFGAVMGAIQGAFKDSIEEADIKTASQVRGAQSRVLAQGILSQHYQQRMEMHPGRDIYPADIFFRGDSAKMCPQGVAIVREIARLNEFRLPYSRIVVASYAKSSSPESTYLQHLTERRSREFVNQLVRAGVEPRRLETRAVVVDAPVLIDPRDDPTRYNQAIEIIPIDR